MQRFLLFDLRTRIAGLGLLFMIFLVSPVYSQYKVYPIKSKEANKQTSGLVYALPKNLLKLDVTVKKSSYIKGPYAEYAAELMGLKDIVRRDSDKYEILNVEISTIAEPDENHLFLVVPDDRYSKENKILFNLTNSGILTSYGSKAENENSSQFFDKIDRINAFSQLPSNGLTVKNDSVIRRIGIGKDQQVIRSFMKTMTSNNPEAKAKEISQFIDNIRESQFNLISGYQEVGYDVGTVKYMNEELTKLLDDYISLFRGKIIEQQKVFTFYVEPKDGGKTVAFKFSDKQGVLDASTSKGQSVNIDIDMSTANQLNSNIPDKIGSQEKNPGGFYYRVPAVCNVSLKLPSGLYENERVIISQFGKIVQAPNAFGNVEFHPNTGSIKSIGSK
ncbi:MAG: DUF4831 family protein [Hyphomicrobiales bacterium]